MKISRSLFFLFFIANMYFAQAQASDPTKAPKADLIVTINGKEYKVAEGEEVQKDGNTISVKLADYKSFDSGSISFSYPTEFAFQYESAFGYKNWTFDGNDFLIMYFEITGGTLDDFVNDIAGRFGRSNCTIEKMSLKLGNQTLKGKRISVNLIGEKLNLDLLEIKLNDGQTRIIAFQDSLDDSGNPTDEGKKAIKKINETISYKE